MVGGLFSPSTTTLCMFTRQDFFSFILILSKLFLLERILVISGRKEEGLFSSYPETSLPKRNGNRDINLKILGFYEYISYAYTRTMYYLNRSIYSSITCFIHTAQCNQENNVLLLACYVCMYAYLPI